MNPTQIIKLIQTELANAKVLVDTEDQVHFHVTVISAEFEGMSAVKRQQKVYAALGSYITSGELHAVAMKTLS